MVEAVTADERHKNRGRKDGDKITGDGNRLLVFDHIVPGFARTRRQTLTVN
jgi:hypothetical protein